MNTFKIAFLSLFITSVSMSAQGYTGQGYGGQNYTGQRNGVGVNRDIARSYSNNKPSAEEIEKDKAKRLDKFMDKLKNDLTLDELQFIAIKNEIAANNKAVDIVLKKGSTEEEKTEEVRALMEKSDQTINSYLNAAQKEKYKLLKADLEAPKKKKKDKKEDKPEDKPNDEQ
ncbi:MAG TPA: hypothetical protein PKN96_04425 [Flavobacterium sp.]|uniref:hypothetical protein n=1 Tax=Flavobacterium sp. TaxID=239 RepID=UPI002B9AB06D|nr:hypothetical protein [Flavobacterium sp.]HNP32513.1 hypothetical protein [Flavobacterium sp.]